MQGWFRRMYFLSGPNSITFSSTGWGQDKQGIMKWVGGALPYSI